MPRRFPAFAAFAAFILLAAGVIGWDVPAAKAAASMYVAGPAATQTGQTVTYTVQVNTGGDSANAFDAAFSYPANLFEGVRGTYSGGICTLPISQPDPESGRATISCGRPSGFSGTGTVVTFTLKAIGEGSGSLGLSSCQVLANDGRGTDITGGCSGRAVTVSSVPAATPPPVAATPKPVNTPTPAKDPKAPATPKPTPAPQGPAGVAQEKPAEPAPTPTPQAPVSATLAPSTPLPVQAGASAAPEEARTRRTVSQAFKDLSKSLGSFGKLFGNATGALALLLALVPVLGFGAAIIFLIYRLYLLERRRRRTLDRLFEMELAELAGLEGKLDLLAEKGVKGREQFKAEFQEAKEKILRQLHPDYAKPVDGGAGPKGTDG